MGEVVIKQLPVPKTLQSLNKCLSNEWMDGFPHKENAKNCSAGDWSRALPLLDKHSILESWPHH
jgi:hypothetical protein